MRVLDTIMKIRFLHIIQHNQEDYINAAKRFCPMRDPDWPCFRFRPRGRHCTERNQIISFLPSLSANGPLMVNTHRICVPSQWTYRSITDKAITHTGLWPRFTRSQRRIPYFETLVDTIVGIVCRRWWLLRNANGTAFFVAIKIMPFYGRHNLTRHIIIIFCCEQILWWWR